MCFLTLAMWSMGLFFIIEHCDFDFSRLNKSTPDIYYTYRIGDSQLHIT